MAGSEVSLDAGNRSVAGSVLYSQTLKLGLGCHEPIEGGSVERLMQNFTDTLSEVFRAIAANKLRSFLTMFGIAWGVGSLLVLGGAG